MINILKRVSLGQTNEIFDKTWRYGVIMLLDKIDLLQFCFGKIENLLLKLLLKSFVVLRWRALGNFSVTPLKQDFIILT